MSWVAAAIGGSALLSAGTSIWGSSKAADAQKAASERAIAAQQAQQVQTRADYAPYRAIGEDATGRLTSRLSELTSPITMTQEQLEKTPGYQWNLAQGMRGVTNSSALRGLGSSGAALKGAAEYATGLANNTYKDQWNMAMKNQDNAYTRLKGLVDTGSNAAGNLAQSGQASAANIGGYNVGAGNAEAASYNAMGGAAANAANTIGQIPLTKAYIAKLGGNINPTNSTPA